MNPLSIFSNTKFYGRRATVHRATVHRVAVQLLALSTLALSGPGVAQTYTTDNLVIEKVYTFATPPGARAAGGYLTITNTGTNDDPLIGGTSSFAKVTEVHEMKMVDDVMKMRHLEDGLVIPAGETVELMPGGFHMMFMQLTQPLKEGESVDATLTFSNAGELPVTYAVIDRRQQSGEHGMQHGHKHKDSAKSAEQSNTVKDHNTMKHDADKHADTLGDMTKAD